MAPFLQAVCAGISLLATAGAKTMQTTTSTTLKTTTHEPGVPIISVQYPKEMPPHGLDGVQVDTNCHGQDLVEVAVAGASDAARAGKGNLVVGACRLACLDNKGCSAWTLNYGSAGMQGRGHCWLKTSCKGTVKDTRAISGTITEDARSKDAEVVDRGAALDRMKDESLQTKKIVGGVVGAGMGALAVGLIGGLLGKKATDAQKQQAGGVGGTRGMGNNLFTGSLDAGSAGRSAGGRSAGGTVGSSMSPAANVTNTSANVTNTSASGLPIRSSRDAALVVPDTSGDSDQEHALTWWWIPLLLLLACLLCFVIWWLCKKLTAAKSSRQFKGGRSSRKRGVSDVGFDVPSSPASSVCSEIPMLDHMESSSNGGSITQPARSAQVGVQDNAAMQAGGDLFDAIDTNHDGIIDKAEFERAMGGSVNAGATALAQQQRQQQWQQLRQQQQAGWQGASATMLVGSSVSMLPAGSSVTILPPTTRAAPAPRLYTTTTTTPPVRPSSMSPPALHGRFLAQQRAPAWL